MPIDKGTTLPITQVTGLQINYKDENSCLNPPIVTTDERDKLVNSNDPNQPIKDGTIVFNSDSNVMEFYQGSTDTWKSAVEGNGDVVGPANSINNNLVAFDGITGKAIKDGGVAANNVVTSTNNGTDLRIAIYDGDSKKIKAGGVTIEDLQVVNSKDKAINATPLYKMSNLGALQFGSNDNVADTATILVDSLTPVTFQTQGVGADAQVCTIINGEEGAGSSSPSALLEINSTTGGFLHARLTTLQRDALIAPQDGTEIDNTDTKKINVRAGGSWVELGAGGIGNVVGPSLSVIDNIVTFNNTTGTLIKDSGINIDSIKNVIFRRVQTIFSVSGGGSFFLPNVDICKITFIGNGGNGGKAQNGYKGCGGGQGGKLVVYLKNLLSIPDFQIRYSSGFDTRGCYMEIDANGYTGQVTFKANMGNNGADGSSSVTSGGTGGTWSVVQTGTIYTADNYSYYGIQGASGGVATNSGVSGYGGGGASGVVGNNPGLNGSSHLASQNEFITGGGGSGASGDGLLGGTGSYGMIIVEY